MTAPHRKAPADAAQQGIAPAEDALEPNSTNDGSSKTATNASSDASTIEPVVADRLSSFKGMLRAAFDRHDNAIVSQDPIAIKQALADIEKTLEDRPRRISGQTMAHFDAVQKIIEAVQLQPIRSAKLGSEAVATEDGGVDFGQYKLYTMTAGEDQCQELVGGIVVLKDGVTIALEHSSWPNFQTIEPVGMFCAGTANTHSLMLQALSVLVSEKYPLFARHIARQLAKNLCSRLITGPCISELESLRLISIGEMAEQMRVAIGQHVSLKGKEIQQARSRGGTSRARVESKKTKSLQKRLDFLVRREGRSKTAACKILAEECGMSWETLMKKLENPKSNRRR